MTSRGIRNNNPGNIRRSNDKWQGLAKSQLDESFFMFESPVYGIRALAVILIVYQDEYGIRSISDIIKRYAPSKENNTAAYIRSVSARTGISSEKQLDLHTFNDIFSLVKAIIWHENGEQPYSDTQITKALVMAGVEPEKEELHKSRTVKGGKLATVATVGAMTAEAVQDVMNPATDAVLKVAPYFDIAKWLLLVVTLVGIAAMLWARIDDKRKGLR